MATRPLVAMVTGAASGIGRAVVERVLADGGRAVAVDRAEEAMAWARDDERVAVVVGDVTDPEVNDRACAEALDRFGRLDAAVLNAGISMSGDLMTLPMSELDRVLQVNVAAVVLGIRSAVPALRANGDDGGAIVVTASVSGLGGDPNRWAYNTSKGAVVNLVRASALDLAADNIRVNAVCPGPTETGMTQRIQAHHDVWEGLRRAVPLQRWGRSDEVAAAICFLASHDASFITGVALPVDGGVTAGTGQFLPRELPGNGPISSIVQ